MNNIKKERDIIAKLMRDQQFARIIAQKQFSAYYEGTGEKVPDFPDTDQDVAVNIAGFYALECGLDYLSDLHYALPSNILISILEGEIPDDEKVLLCRFANATWKAGQPFRGLERLERPVFVPFSELPEHEVDKDWKQILSAASIVLEYLQKDDQ